MEKVKNIYFNDHIKSDSEFSSPTGLFIELENGKIYRHQTTDPVIAFERTKELPKD